MTDTTPSRDAALRRVPCPGCGRACEFSPRNRWRPFCSERCKGGDFGAWASERYRMPADMPRDDEDADTARG